MNDIACARCGVTKPRSEYYPSNLKRGYAERGRPWCKGCFRQYYRDKRKATPGISGHYAQRRRREALLAVQGMKSERGCAHCAERHPACLEFHHADWTTKGDTISKMVARVAPFEQIVAEAKKCVVLCSNCHRKLHWEQGGNRNKKAIVLPLRPARIARRG